ncbi:hypothetical protein HYH02_008272 [Chlamydomonas schloesseri]|uniref:G-patch domain-containing protein n=1 Tax=Chlamydomonas schloesseri TaxID=2026947 RepID=A0A836B3Q0_9CHLO|nr:hypothetical protein HYH02_008272 [Chlamydomonas schloesseri]|eukprot:KAG2446707.1 hypothetical protein HYH02_008272 [Chlamydomonas schloesseri]
MDLTTGPIGPEPKAPAPTSAPLPGFRSSGIHVLEAYISPACFPTASRAQAGTRLATGSSAWPGTAGAKLRNSAGIDDAPEPAAAGRAGIRSAASAPGPAPAVAGASGASSSTVWTGGIDADNVGFKLLKQAGWRVGTGLGAAGQGRHEPIEPNAAKGTRGLGFDSAAAREQQRQQQEQHRQQQVQARGAAGVSGAGGVSAAQRMKRLAEEELAKEPMDAKVARHRSVMRAEAEQERGRAIERYLRSAFNDPFDSLHSDNSNPLARRHALSSSNPLLDPIGD